MWRRVSNTIMNRAPRKINIDNVIKNIVEKLIRITVYYKLNWYFWEDHLSEIVC